MIRLDKVRKKSQAGQRKKWQDEEGEGASDTISSEDDASDYEISEPGREKQKQEIWNDEEIWNDLQVSIEYR